MSRIRAYLMLLALASFALPAAACVQPTDLAEDATDPPPTDTTNVKPGGGYGSNN